MALNLSVSSSVHPKLSSPSLLSPKHNHAHILYSPYSSHQFFSYACKAAAQSEGLGGEVTKEESSNLTGYISSARTQLDLLEQLTSTSSSTDGYTSEGEYPRPTIRDQLSQLVGDRDGEDFSIPLGKNLKKVSSNFLTTSQKRNIKRQDYLHTVSKRNDAVFYATIAAFVILPPILILGVAVITGDVQLLP